MIRYLLIALLLIPTLASAGQGMGPGPGIYYAKVMPPAQVTLTALSSVSDQFTVTWGAVSGATSYNVYYSTSNNSSGATKISTSTTDTSYNISGLTAGTYYVWVSAQKAAIEGALSAPLSTPVAGSGPTDGVEGWVAQINGAGDIPEGTGQSYCVLDNTSHSGSVAYHAHSVTDYWSGDPDSGDGSGYYWDHVNLVKTTNVSSGYISFWYKIPVGTLDVGTSVFIDSSGAITPTTALIADGLWHQASFPTDGYTGVGRTIKIDVTNGGSLPYTQTPVIADVWVDDIVVP